MALPVASGSGSGSSSHNNVPLHSNASDSPTAPANGKSNSPSASAQGTVGLMLPPPVPAPARKRDRRKLACQACRARRIKCDWSDDSGCLACAMADLRCPGEPEPRKRRKRGEPLVPEPDYVPKPSNKPVDPLQRFAPGGALTFHLVEAVFTMANPCIYGMDYNLYRKLLHSIGCASLDMEIAAECLCSAFIASSATFSDHVAVVGTGDIEMPTDLVSGVYSHSINYDALVPYGPRRQKIVQALAVRALKVLDDSGLKDKPGIETIYTLLALDHSSTLTADGGRKSCEYLVAAVGHWKHLCERKEELSEEQRSLLLNEIGRHLFSHDAQVAAQLGQPLLFSQVDLYVYFAHLDFNTAPTANVEPARLIGEEDSWTELGKQLAPLHLSIALLYRRYIQDSDDLISKPFESHIWSSIDSAYKALTEVVPVLGKLPSLDTPAQNDRRHAILLSLVNDHRRALVRLDLLIHERIIERALELNRLENGDQDQAESDAAYAAADKAYEVSRERVQRAVALVVELAKQGVALRSVIQVRRLFEVMEACSTWTSLRAGEDDGQNRTELLHELGLDKDSGLVLCQALALASWSSPLAGTQLQSLRDALSGPKPAESDSNIPAHGVEASSVHDGSNGSGPEAYGTASPIPYQPLVNALPQSAPLYAPQAQHQITIPPNPHLAPPQPHHFHHQHQSFSQPPQHPHLVVPSPAPYPSAARSSFAQQSIGPPLLPISTSSAAGPLPYLSASYPSQLYGIASLAAHQPSQPSAHHHLQQQQQHYNQNHAQFQQHPQQQQNVVFGFGQGQGGGNGQPAAPGQSQFRSPGLGAVQGFQTAAAAGWHGMSSSS